MQASMGERQENSVPEEKYYTVRELANLWKVDRVTVRRYVRGRDGVMQMGRSSGLRIPRRVVEEITAERQHGKRKTKAGDDRTNG
jgi:hypothetical protein